MTVGSMNRLFLLVIVIVSAGCFQLQMLPYMDQALVLQEFGAEKDRQQKYVTNANAAFDKLLAEAQSGTIKNYKTQDDIIKAFGPPVLSKDVMVNSQLFKRNMYCHAIVSKAKQKVYLFFDAQGNLTQWEIL